MHRMSTCHKKQTFIDLISCGFHNPKINMAHVVKCSNGLREACTMLFLRNMTLEDRKLNIKVNVQLTVLQIKRSILARGAKGLARKNPENIKIVQRSDLAWISSQIRLWQLIRSAVLQK